MWTLRSAESPYHGRKLDNLNDFLDAVTPACAVVCTSAEEFASKTQNALSEMNIPTYSTCYNGRITAVSNGRDLNVTSENKTGTARSFPAVPFYMKAALR